MSTVRHVPPHPQRREPWFCRTAFTRLPVGPSGESDWSGLHRGAWIGRASAGARATRRGEGGGGGPPARRRRARGASRGEEARPLAGFGEGGGGGGAEAVAAAPNRGKRGPCSAARCTLCPRVERPPPRSSKEEAPPDARREEGGARRGGSAQGMGGSGRRYRAAQLSAVEEELEEGRAGGVGGREGEGARARVQGAAKLTVGGFVPEVELRTEAWGRLDHEHRRHERWRGRGGRS